MQKAHGERDHALLEAKDLAEKLKEEKRELVQTYAGRVETVRDFWRSKIIEGDSRGGRLLRASLLRKNVFSCDSYEMF